MKFRRETGTSVLPGFSGGTKREGRRAARRRPAPRRRSAPAARSAARCRPSRSGRRPTARSSGGSGRRCPCGCRRTRARRAAIRRRWAAGCRSRRPRPAAASGRTRRPDRPPSAALHTASSPSSTGLSGTAAGRGFWSASVMAKLYSAPPSGPTELTRPRPDRRGNADGTPLAAPGPDRLSGRHRMAGRLHQNVTTQITETTAGSTGSIVSEDRRGTRRARPPGQRRGGPSRRRGHRPVHRPVPQGGDRHARRRAAANARRAPPLPARARGAADRDSRQHRRAGQAHRRAAGADRRRRHQGQAGGPLPPLQAQAQDQGPDRPRERPRAAGRPAARHARRPTRGRRPRRTSTRTWPTSPPPSTAPARSWSSASPRTPT